MAARGPTGPIPWRSSDRLTRSTPDGGLVRTPSMPTTRDGSPPTRYPSYTGNVRSLGETGLRTVRAKRRVRPDRRTAGVRPRESRRHAGRRRPRRRGRTQRRDTQTTRDVPPSFPLPRDRRGQRYRGAVKRLGVKWFERRRLSSSPKTLSSVRPRGFLILRGALQIPPWNPQRAQSQQAWIRPLPDRRDTDGRASDCPRFRTVNQTRFVPSHLTGGHTSSY
jgi:hypothetical protein